jgi:hypothetical protein
MKGLPEVTATDFRTDWEAAQFAADQGAGAAIGQGFQGLGAILTEHGARDAALLGLTRLPAPSPYMVAIMDGAEAERMARIDAFAAAHGVRAGWDTRTRTYRAVAQGGAYIAFTRPEADRELNERLARRRTEEFRAELAAARREAQEAGAAA